MLITPAIRHNRGLPRWRKPRGVAIALRVQRSDLGFIKGEVVLGVPSRAAFLPGHKGFRILRGKEWTVYPAALFRPCNADRFVHWPAGVLRPARSAIAKLPYGSAMDEFGWPLVA